MNNKPFLLALNRIPQIGPRTVDKLTKVWPNLADLFGSSAQALELQGIKPSLATAILEFDMKKIEEDYAWEKQSGCKLLTIEDPGYPPLLKEIYDPPPVLYAKGDMASLRQITIAMVGSRNPSPMGLETAKYFAHELAQKNITIVSGLALGIDAQAHQGCLAAGGKTIAVMGSGIDCIYPYRHRKLAGDITQNGLLLTEFPLHVAPIAGHFPRRNRIISGLSLAILVVEAAVKSGSLITAQLALEQNRDVLAIPGSIHNPKARGCHYLLQQGAKLITSTDDVLSELGLDNANYTQLHKKTMLASEAEKLVKFIDFEVTPVDRIIERSGFSVEKVIGELANLEIKGLVKAVSGGYLRCIL